MGARAAMARAATRSPWRKRRCAVAAPAKPNGFGLSSGLNERRARRVCRFAIEHSSRTLALIGCPRKRGEHQDRASFQAWAAFEPTSHRL